MLLNLFSAVVVKNPADFIGAALGQSESNTKTILANTLGKVLVIDEVSEELALRPRYLNGIGIHAIRRRYWEPKRQLQDGCH